MMLTENETSNHSTCVQDSVGDVGSALPLTAAQQYVWGLSQIKPGNPACNLAIRFRLDGAVDVEQVSRAANVLVQRHDALRTKIVLVGDTPKRVILPECQIDLEIDDLADVPVADRDSESESIAREEARRPFDLTHAPLIRTRLVRLDDRYHILLITAHQMVCDGWSSGILLRELASTYDALCRGVVPTLPPLPLTSVDHAVWEAEQLPEVTGTQLPYWKQQLFDIPALTLTADRPRPAVRSFQGDIVSLLLPGDRTARLREVAKHYKVTPYLILLSVYQALLHRHSGCIDFSVGTMLSGRSRVEFEPLVGLFVNTVVLRCDLSANPTFLELFGRARDTLASALENQNVPFQYVVDAVDAESKADRHPLFQAMFLYQQDFCDSIHAGELAISPIPSLSPGTFYDLNCFLVQRTEGLRLSFEYDSDLFDKPKIQGFLTEFDAILRAVLCNPEITVHGLIRLPAPEAKMPGAEKIRRQRSICLDDHWDAAMKMSAEPLTEQVDSASTACVIYASGSAGRPDGVPLGHSAAGEVLRALSRELGITVDDTWLALTPLQEDMSLPELLLPLTVGAKVYIANNGETADGKQLLKLLGFSGATMFHATPKIIRKLVDSGWQGHESLKVLFSHESPEGELAEFFSCQCSMAWSLYGHTEAHIVSAVTRCVRNDRSVTIRSPIDNTQLYVLDRSMRPTPVGVSGELYIGGAGVARGYWNRPELTHQRFVPNPFGLPGSRLFRTGDRVRRLHNGDIELLGRFDRQVWIQGLRIDLGEVEAVITRQPNVSEAVVLVLGGKSNERRLIAFIVPSEGRQIDKTTITSSLLKELSDVMTPAEFIILNQIPRTSNGAIDIAALPNPCDTTHATAENPRPLNEHETWLVGIWSQLLGVTPSGIMDNFFDLGGNSLLMMRLLLRAEKEFGVKISFPAFLQDPTISALANLLRADMPQAKADRSPLWALRSEGTRPPIILLECGPNVRALAAELGSDQPVYGLEYPEQCELPDPLMIADVAGKLADAICDSNVKGPFCLAGWSVAGTVAFETARQLRSRGQEVYRLFLFDAANPGYQRRFRTWWKLPLWYFVYFDRFTYHLGQMIRMTPSEALHYFRQHGMFRHIKNIKQMRKELPHRIDFLKLYAACDDYRPTSIDVPIAVFRSAVSDGTTGWFRQPGLGWEKFAGGGIEMFKMSGDHGAMFKEPELQRLAFLIKHCIG